MQNINTVGGAKIPIAY